MLHAAQEELVKHTCRHIRKRSIEDCALDVHICLIEFALEQWTLPCKCHRQRNAYSLSLKFLLTTPTQKMRHIVAALLALTYVLHRVRLEKLNSVLTRRGNSDLTLFLSSKRKKRSIKRSYTVSRMLEPIDGTGDV